MNCSRNSSQLHFVHRMCKETSFYHDEILMFTRNPSQVRDLQRTFNRFSVNEMYYIRALLNHLLTNVALITKEWDDGQNNVLQSMDLTPLDNSNELP